jgi:hypothetical protein
MVAKPNLAPQVDCEMCTTVFDVAYYDKMGFFCSTCAIVESGRKSLPLVKCRPFVGAKNVIKKVTDQVN